jgi:hypothetical protein
MNWISTKDKLPDKDAACLVVRKRYVEILVWNNTHECWDDSDGDDFCCNLDDVKYWILLSDLPPIPND